LAIISVHELHRLPNIDTTNPWSTLYDSGVMIAMSIVDGGLAAAVIAYAIYQLVVRIKNNIIIGSSNLLIYRTI
jgi:hypothetical protein